MRIKMIFKENFLSVTGATVTRNIRFAGYTILVLLKAVYFMKFAFRRRHEVMKQMFNAGVRTFMVVSIVAMFTGMILTIQTGVALLEYRMEHMIGNVVIATLTREMAPFTAAIILIAAVGSTMAAEIGTMKVSEEIDALEIMSISPINFLVMPRVLALSIILPMVTVYINILGVIGGALIAKSHLNMTFNTFYIHVLQSLHFKAVYVGLLKSFVFGLSISTICCCHGLRASDGALGVGKATRDSVVASFLIVLVIGYFITEIFFKDGL